MAGYGENTGRSIEDDTRIKQFSERLIFIDD